MYIPLIITALLSISLAEWRTRQERQANQEPIALTPPPSFQLLPPLNDSDPHPKRPGQRKSVPSLYHKRYSEQTFIGTHDAAAIRSPENNWSLSGNQYFNLSVQLYSGVRLIQAQGHPSLDPSDDDIHLCHFNCALMDSGTLRSHLLTIKDFLEREPFEVVTLLFVNAGPPLEHWAQAYYDTGLDLLSYIPPSSKRGRNMKIGDWPTIAELVNTNQRLITFLSRGADEDQVPFLLPEFDYLFETDFINDSPEDYSCDAARPWIGQHYIPDMLSLVNHFLYAQFLGFRYPNASYANTTNAAGFHIGELGEHAARCRSAYGRRPNFLLVDFFNEGDVFDVEYGMNAYD